MSEIYNNSSINGTNVRVFEFKRRITGAVLRFFWRWMPEFTRKLLKRFFMSTGSYADAREQVRVHPHVALHTTHGLGHRRIVSDDQIVHAALEHIGAPMHEAKPYARRIKMNLHQSIIEQYAAAEEDQRLGLYLIHRGLREEFMKIDLAEAAEPAPQVKQTLANNCLGKFHQYCLGWLKLGRV